MSVARNLIRKYLGEFSTPSNAAWNGSLLQFRGLLREVIEQRVLRDWRSDVFDQKCSGGRDDNPVYIERGTTEIAIIGYLLNLYYLNIAPSPAESQEALKFLYFQTLKDVYKEFFLFEVFRGVKLSECADRSWKLIERYRLLDEAAREVTTGPKILAFLSSACHELGYSRESPIAAFICNIDCIIEELFETC